MPEISDLEAQYELETDDSELSDGSDQELEYENDEEFGEEPAGELDAGQTYAERFAELAMREFETDEELESGLRDILGEMEQQYFLSGLVKKGIGFATNVAKKAAKRGLKFATSKLPIAQLLKGASGMLGKSLTDKLLRLAQSVIPGGAIGIPALQALGIIPGGGAASPEANAEIASDSETWERFAEFAQEVYETAADQANETLVNPMQAMQAANTALNTVVRQNAGGLVTAGVGALRGPMGGGQRGHHGGRRVVRLRPGQSVVIVCK
jgi:hypothetical protein